MRCISSSDRTCAAGRSQAGGLCQQRAGVVQARQDSPEPPEDWHRATHPAVSAIGGGVLHQVRGGVGGAEEAGGGARRAAASVLLHGLSAWRRGVIGTTCQRGCGALVGRKVREIGGTGRQLFRGSLGRPAEPPPGLVPLWAGPTAPAGPQGAAAPKSTNRPPPPGLSLLLLLLGSAAPEGTHPRARGGGARALVTWLRRTTNDVWDKLLPVRPVSLRFSHAGIAAS